MTRMTAAWSGSLALLTSVAGIMALASACTPQRAMVGPAVGSATPVASVARPSPVAEVTVRDDGGTLELAAGQRFLLNLGQGYDWTVTISDSSIVQRVVYDMINRDAQGLYEAERPGEAAVSATGEPRCRRAPPGCDVPPQTFTLTVTVR